MMRNGRYTGWFSNSWNIKSFRNSWFKFKLDTDGDGVDDFKDCKPLDRKRQDLSPAAQASRQQVIQQLQAQQQNVTSPAQRAQYQSAVQRLQSSPGTAPQRQPISVQQAQQLAQQRIRGYQERHRPPLTTLQRPSQRTDTSGSGQIIPSGTPVKQFLPTNPVAHSWLGRMMGWDR